MNVGIPFLAGCHAPLGEIDRQPGIGLEQLSLVPIAGPLALVVYRTDDAALLTPSTE